jgi:hypothetical protein
VSAAATAADVIASAIAERECIQQKNSTNFAIITNFTVLCQIFAIEYSTYHSC